MALPTVALEAGELSRYEALEHDPAVREGWRALFRAIERTIDDEAAAIALGWRPPADAGAWPARDYARLVRATRRRLERAALERPPRSASVDRPRARSVRTGPRRANAPPAGEGDDDPDGDEPPPVALRPQGVERGVADEELRADLGRFSVRLSRRLARLEEPGPVRLSEADRRKLARLLAGEDLREPEGGRR